MVTKVIKILIFNYIISCCTGHYFVVYSKGHYFVMDIIFTKSFSLHYNSLVDDQSAEAVEYTDCFCAVE